MLCIFTPTKAENTMKKHLENQVKFFTNAYKTCHKSMKAYYFGEAVKYQELLFSLENQ